MPQSTPGSCILFSIADWRTPYWTNKQHTARHLAKRGIRVLYIESIGLRPPRLGNSRDWSRIWRRLCRSLAGIKQVEPGIWVLSPLLIPFKHHWPMVRAFNQGMLRYRIGRFLHKQKFTQPMVWTYHPFMLESLPFVGPGPLIYHCVDDLTAIPSIDAAAFNREEKRLLASAHIVFTTSPALRDKCAKYHARVYDFPNVADIDHFGRAHQPGPLPTELQAIPEPRIGYIGVLSDFKVDFALVLSIAERCPDWHWVFIGDERAGQTSPLIARLREMPNVHFLRHRPYAQLPEYLKGINVGALPTLINDYTRAMFPMKYFEYLAAGVPVVSTPLDFTRYHSAGLQTGADAEGFIEGIKRQLQRGKLSPQEAIAAVGDNTWEVRLTKMLSLLEGS